MSPVSRFNIFSFKKIFRFVLILAALVFMFFWTRNLFYKVNQNMTEPVALIIESGDSLDVISHKLENAGAISNAWLFKVYAYLRGKQTKFQASEYRLEPPFSISTVLDELTVNPGRYQSRSFVIYEGWRTVDIGEALAKLGWGTANEFYALQKDMRDELNQRYDFLAERPKDADLEGYLYPDTYRVSKNTSMEQLLIKILDNFASKVTPELRAEIKNNNHSLHTILTMASIIEREVPNPEDRRIVSGIFWHRLDIGMPLQSDATINHVNATRATRPTLDDLKTDSKYNTYLYKGLPPGPICNPSLDAIKAALYPSESDYLYFLSARDGRTIFSRTYQEHLVAISKYLD